MNMCKILDKIYIICTDKHLKIKRCTTFYFASVRNSFLLTVKWVCMQYNLQYDFNVENLKDIALFTLKYAR